MSELWCDFAIPLPGPASKTGYQDDAGNRILETHDKVGIDYHTMEYESPDWFDDAKTLYNALFSGREASWIFSICTMFGAAWLYQHYPLNAVTWAQGYQGNLWLVGIETESKDKHKFTEPEYALLVKVSKWIKQNLGWGDWRGVGSRQTKLAYGVNGWLFEHNNTPLAPGTDCAVFTHGQVDPEQLLRDLREEDMSFEDEDRNRLKAIENLVNRIYEQGRDTIVKRVGRDEYFLVVDMEELVYISPSALKGGRGEAVDVQELPDNDPIWLLPTTFSGGVPELK